METLLSRYRATVVLIAVLFAQVVLLAWQVKRHDSDVPLFREWVQAVLAPPLKAISAGLRNASDFWYNYADLRHARDQSRRLEEELDRQRITNHLLREEVQELRRLKALLAFREQSSLTTVAARVIGSGAADTSRVLFLNKGLDDGLQPNQSVITPEGIVGKVQRAFRNSAQVLMINDNDSGVGVLLENSRVHGVLKGQNGQYCQLRYVLNDEKVEVGGRVLTSGEDRIYPKGLPVGAVVSARPGPIFKEILVQPAARLNRVEEVLVVVKAPEAETTLAQSRSAEMAPSPPAPGPAAASPASPEPSGEEAERTLPSGSYRPGIPRGTRPETDADRIREAFRRRMAQGTPKSQPAAKPAPPPNTTEPQP